MGLHQFIYNVINTIFVPYTQVKYKYIESDYEVASLLKTQCDCLNVVGFTPSHILRSNIVLNEINLCQEFDKGYKKCSTCIHHTKKLSYNSKGLSINVDFVLRHLVPRPNVSIACSFYM